MTGGKGDKGDRGEQGKRGEPGLSMPVRRALVFMFVFMLVLSGVNLWWTAHAIQANNHSRCASLEADASIPVPQPVARNPSREFDARLEAIDRRRLRMDGCTRQGGG